jgi:hypothetical protein
MEIPREPRLTGRRVTTRKLYRYPVLMVMFHFRDPLILSSIESSNWNRHEIDDGLETFQLYVPDSSQTKDPDSPKIYSPSSLCSMLLAFVAVHDSLSPMLCFVARIPFTPHPTGWDVGAAVLEGGNGL